MFRVTVLMLIICSLLTVACEDEILETRPSNGQLEFSKDTVFLDTVFTNTSSSTRTFKVYNRSSENINLPTILEYRARQDERTLDGGTKTGPAR